MGKKKASSRIKRRNILKPKNNIEECNEPFLSIANNAIHCKRPNNFNERLHKLAKKLQVVERMGEIGREIYFANDSFQIIIFYPYIIEYQKELKQKSNLSKEEQSELEIMQYFFKGVDYMETLNSVLKVRFTLVLDENKVLKYKTPMHELIHRNVFKEMRKINEISSIEFINRCSYEQTLNNEESDSDGECDNDDLCYIIRACKSDHMFHNFDKLMKMSKEEIKNEVLELIDRLVLLDYEYKNCKSIEEKLKKSEKHLKQYYKYMRYSGHGLLREYEKSDYYLLATYFKH